ncbi:hypothetical protein [Fructilactobacillus fructivorans]|uniref:Uncharacterized protein n=1 Tax=Fructilactobacillus fructivorans TaxID=1614 RepID=A0A0C1PR64_9LACO|nr:hypothetical protein [Fructilactobacillus fructivorans]KID42371.1 hypothetical protein LfDm3_0300 [Fructilactobacillus fructivorans]MCT0151012.1 hypothetical protein [Fructilactobacillus fructivorans]MCT2867430.1 hypothetical protein [Fructilactobacillus fructivorans]MCT2869051.1 hypothetical protein [Fructilactobacillus fructivorans]MCT2873229.1 hypothetical protein [Fructilactobacillus fructivorans]
MEDIDIDELKPTTMVEYFENERKSKFDVGYVLKHNDQYALMRTIDLEGRLDNYELVDLTKENPVFNTGTPYLKQMIEYRTLATEYGLKDTPQIKAIEDLPFKNPLQEILEYLSQNGVNFEVVTMGKKHHKKDYIGYMKNLKQSKFSLISRAVDDPFDPILNEKHKIKLKKIEIVCFNSWELILLTDLIKND